MTQNVCVMIDRMTQELSESPFVFSPGGGDGHTENSEFLEIGNFSPAVSPAPTTHEERRRTFEKRTETGTSIEPYIGNYTYYIGQSKYYKDRKQPDDVNLETEIGEFFSQHTKEPDISQGRPVSTNTGGSYLTVTSAQRSHEYLKAQMTSMVPQFTDSKIPTKEHFDVLGVPTQQGIPSDYQAEYLASSLLNALTQMQAKKAPPTLSFPTNVRFFNLIVYFKDLPDELDADVRLPQTSIPIIGNTLKELIITNKSWIITDGCKQPFANLLGDALYKANKQEKELTESLRKRMHLTGLVTQASDEKTKRRQLSVENLDPPCEIFPLTRKEQKELDEVISPYTGMTLWLALSEFKDPYLKEKVIWHISQKLRIPAIVVQLHQTDSELGLGQMFQTSNLRVAVLSLRDRCPVEWTKILDLQGKKATLQNVILRMANSYFENPDIDFKQWNTITPSIFLQSAKQVNERLNGFNLELEDYKQPVHAKIIDRTIRYALIFGNREVVETIVNNPIFQKIIIKRRLRIVEDLYQKAAQEVYLFSRIILVIEGPSFKFSNAHTSVNNFLRKFFEMIFGGGFIWETPSEHVPMSETPSRDLDDDDDESQKLEKPLTEEEMIVKRAAEFYFSEYVFVWALICLKFDVAELFLEYSGVHKQDFDRGEVYQTNKGIYQIGNALAASKILTGMSKILKEDTSVSKEEHETMKEHAQKYENIAIGLLNEALKHEVNLREIFEQKLPFWNETTLIDLAQQARLSSFFSERSITRHVDNEWNGLNNRKPGRDLIGRIITPRNTFFLHVTFYILFLIMITLLICFYWRDTTTIERDVIFGVYIVYVVTNYVDEIYQYNSFLSQKYKAKANTDRGKWENFKENVRIFKAAFVEYLSSIWNLLDIIIVCGFIISVVTYFVFRNSSGNAFQYVRIYFGLFSTLFYIRFFQYILIFPGIGPLVYTCIFAFKRMLYFLVIIILVALCFGIAVVALTQISGNNDNSGDQMQRFIVFLYYPLFQVFGEYFLEDLSDQNFVLIELSNTTRDEVFGSTRTANFWLTTQFLTYLAIIAWLLIANVLLLNLMIAYFSQIYEDVAKNADSIYLLNFLEIVEEYRDKSFLPAPFNLIIYTLRGIKFCFSRREKKKKKMNTKELTRRQTNLLMGLKSRRLFITKAVSFGWHIELSFADYYWKKVGEDRYAAIADREKAELKVKRHIEEIQDCPSLYV